MSDILYDSGVLSDVDIREFWGKGIEIDTYQKGDWAFDLDKQLQLGSIDLRFRPDYKKFNLNEKDTIKYDSILQKRYTTPYDLDVDENLVLNPGDVVLTTTLETVRLSEEFAGILTGRSSIARLGIMVHCCQEFINPGHGQPIPLQLINLSPRTVELDRRIPICQLVILKLRTPSSGRYKESIRAKYSEETDAQESKVYEDIPCPIHNKDGSLTQAKMEPSKAVHKENDLTSQKEDIENSSQKIFANNIKLKSLFNTIFAIINYGFIYNTFFHFFCQQNDITRFSHTNAKCPLIYNNRHFTFYIIHFSKEGIVMKVYIASKYIAHKKINNEIYQALKNNGIDAFLPETINNNATDKENMLLVSEKCFSEIEICDIILAVCPFGKSVSCEIGYAIALKKKYFPNKKIIALNIDFKEEAMLYPYIDISVNGISELISVLKSIV